MRLKEKAALAKDFEGSQMGRDALSAPGTERARTSAKKHPLGHALKISFTLHAIHNWDTSSNDTYFCKAEGLVMNNSIVERHSNPAGSCQLAMSDSSCSDAPFCLEPR